MDKLLVKYPEIKVWIDTSLIIILAKFLESFCYMMGFNTDGALLILIAVICQIIYSVVPGILFGFLFFRLVVKNAGNIPILKRFIVEWTLIAAGCLLSINSNLYHVWRWIAFPLYGLVSGLSSIIAIGIAVIIISYCVFLIKNNKITK